MDSVFSETHGTHQPAPIADPPQPQGFGQCRAVVLSCIDYRYLPRLYRYLERECLVGAADLVAWPGGAVALTNTDRDIVLGALRIATSLHGPAEIILTVHRDCARLGGSDTFAGPLAETAVLEQMLGFAGDVAAAELPSMRIRLLLLDHRQTSAVEYVPDCSPVIPT